MIHRLNSLFAFAALLLLSACAQNPLQIGHTLTECCPGDYDDYESYSIDTENMPIFLRDYVVEEFDKAFQEKGLTRDDRMRDLKVLLRYDHVNLEPEQEDIDPFVRMESIDTELSYIANVVVEMRETATDELVFAGRIHRIHNVRPGEYMHEDSARGHFLMAFRELLAAYPDSESR